MTVPVNGSAPAWCVRLIGELRAADGRATALAGVLTREQINWRPAPGAWSIGQCLDHLRVANEVYAEAMSPALTGARPHPVQDIRPGWFGRWFLRNYIEPSAASRRARAPRKIVPSPDVDTSVLDAFLVSNERARALILAAAGYDVNRIRFPNPFVPVIRFTIGTGFEILSKHQSRHLQQAEGVNAQLARAHAIR